MPSLPDTFEEYLASLDLVGLARQAEKEGPEGVRRALSRPSFDLYDLAVLLSPAAGRLLGELAEVAARVRERRFGRTMRLFAPLYLSNHCASVCTYCGFSAWNRGIVRKTLAPEEVEAEARALYERGFRHILLVSGEQPHWVNPDYLEEVVARVHALGFANVSIETQTWPEEVYRRLAAAGTDGVVVYQETYDREAYASYHLKGSKRNYFWRLGAPERATRAGMRRVGLGVLLGLTPDWRVEVLALAAHARFLLKRHWRAEVTLSLPRLRPAAGFPGPRYPVEDAEFVQAHAALRIFLPDVGLVLSTRERPELRDGLALVAVTQMSAGSRTEPGGYLHPDEAEEQFAIADTRSADEVARALAREGLDPVWKDWVPLERGGVDPSGNGAGRALEGAGGPGPSKALQGLSGRG